MTKVCCWKGKTVETESMYDCMCDSHDGTTWTTSLDGTTSLLRDNNFDTSSAPAQ